MTIAKAAYSLFLVLMQEVERVVTRDYQEQMLGLIHKNNKALNYAHDCFRHAGQVFYKEVYPSNAVPLHHSLHSAFDEVTAPYLAFNTEKAYIHAYLSVVTTEHCNIEDTLKLLPSALHSLVLNTVKGYYPEEGKLSPEDVQRIQEKHSKGVEYIRHRLVLNMIGG